MRKTYQGPLKRRRAVLEYSDDARTPLLPGERGWRQPVPRDELVNGWHSSHLHYPSLIRVWARDDIPNFPRMTESKMMGVMEDLFRDKEKRKSLRRPVGLDVDHQDFAAYLNSSRKHLSAWTRHTGVCRSHFKGQREVMEDLLDGGHLTNWEIAHFRIPDSLSNDSQVVIMQAKTQGLSTNDLRAFTRETDPYPITASAGYAQEGLERLLEDRWFRFGLVAPYMTQFGIDLGSGFTRNVTRAEFLLSNPYHATSGELDALEASPSYLSAWPVAMGDLSLSTRFRRPPPPSGMYYPTRRGQIRETTLDKWCFWQKSRTRHGGY